MQLYLVQHGEAKPEEEDPERRLTENGARDVREIADFLLKARVSVDAIWHSGKPRAQQTAELLAGAVGAREGVFRREGLAPKDAVAPIKQQIEQSNANVILVGHLPFLGRLAGLLLTENEESEIVVFQFGCVVCLERDETGRWRLGWMIAPKLL